MCSPHIAQADTAPSITGASNISTYAGGYGDGALATDISLSRFGAKLEIAFDASDNLYIADHSGNTLLKLNPDHTVTRLAGGGSLFAPGQSLPPGLAEAAIASLTTNRAGKLYYRDGNRIVSFDNNQILPVVTDPGDNSVLSATTTMGFDGSNNLYFADTNIPALRMLDIGANTLSIIAGNPPNYGTTNDGDPAITSSMGNVGAFEVDSQANLYMSENMGGLRMIDQASGAWHTLSSTSFTPFSLIKADRQDNVYASILDASSQYKLYKITPGEVAQFLTDQTPVPMTDVSPAALQTLPGPNGTTFAPSILSMAFDSQNRTYLAIGPAENYQSSAPREHWSTVVYRQEDDLSLTPVAGNGLPYGGDGGPATQAQLAGSASAATDGEGNLYISGGNVIRKVDATGVISTVLGNLRKDPGYSVSGSRAVSVPASDALFSSTGDLVIDKARNILYVIDAGSHFNGETPITDSLVRAVDLNRLASGDATVDVVAGDPVNGAGNSGDGGDPKAAKLQAAALALDSQGDLYIANYLVGDHLISNVRKVNLQTGNTPIITTVAGTSRYPVGYSGDRHAATEAQLNRPTSLVFDQDDNLLIADSLNNAIRKVDHATGIITTWIGDGSPGIARDGGPTANSQLTRPTALTRDDNGNIYFVTGNYPIHLHKVDSRGVMTSIANDESARYYSAADGGDNGPATLAQMNISDLTSGDNGELFVAGSSRIRKISPSTANSPTIYLRGEGRVAAKTGIACATAQSPCLLPATQTKTILSATAATGYSFTGWTGDCSGRKACVVNPANVQAVVANFSPYTQLHFVQSGDGDIKTSPPGLPCGDGCRSFPKGSQVKVTLKPAAGKAPQSNWCLWRAGKTANQCIIDMSYDNPLHVNFLPALSVRIKGKGTVSAGSVTSAKAFTIGIPVPLSSALVVSANPAPGYRFVRWQGGCTGSGSCEVPKETNAAVAITAIFAKQ